MVHGAATLSVAGLLGVVFVLAPGPVRRMAVGGVAALVVGGALSALFADGDWTTGGGHRRHATFLLTYGPLAGVGTVLVRAAVDPYDAVGRGLLVLVLVYALAAAGWVAYLGGLRMLSRVWAVVVGRVCAGPERPGAGGD